MKCPHCGQTPAEFRVTINADVDITGWIGFNDYNQNNTDPKTEIGTYRQADINLFDHTDYTWSCCQHEITDDELKDKLSAAVATRLEHFHALIDV